MFNICFKRFILIMHSFCDHFVKRAQWKEKMCETQKDIERGAKTSKKLCLSLPPSIKFLQSNQSAYTNKMMWGWTMCSFQRHQCLLLSCGIMQHSFIHHSNNNDICQEANETFPKENWYPAFLKYGTIPESCFASARLVLASSFLNSFPLFPVDLDSCQKTATSLKHK